MTHYVLSNKTNQLIQAGASPVVPQRLALVLAAMAAVTSVEAVEAFVSQAFSMVAAVATQGPVRRGMCMERKARGQAASSVLCTASSSITASASVIELQRAQARQLQPCTIPVSAPPLPAAASLHLVLAPPRPSPQPFTQSPLSTARRPSSVVNMKDNTH